MAHGHRWEDRRKVLKVRVGNPDLFALDYSRLDVDIGYRVKQLGRVTWGGRSATSDVDADLQLDGKRVIEEVIYNVSYVEADLQLDGKHVIEDVIYCSRTLHGCLPFDTILDDC